MMPLTMARQGATQTIGRVSGKEKTKRFLESLGFTVGGQVTIISELGGNLIVNVKDTRVAISKAMASQILVSDRR